MTRALLPFILLCLSFFACKPDTSSSSEIGKQTSTPAGNKGPVSSIKLTQTWESPASLKTAESVLFDEENGLYFVSCIGEVPPNAEDKDGYIAQIDQRGNILKATWAKGLDAPKGMGILGDELYVTDINELVIIDKKTGYVRKRIEVWGSKFLNDIAISPSGEIFISDSNTNKIHQYKEGKVHTYLEDEALGGPNGLYVDEERIYVASFGSGDVHTIDRASKKLTKHGKATVPGGDGVEPWMGGMVFSNWNGEVYFLDANWNASKVLDTKEDKKNAADIEINQKTGQLLIPTFFGNSVVAYDISSK